MRVGDSSQMLNSINIYKKNSSNLSKAIEKLSSGFKINRAADDAAGLAISEKMRFSIASLNRSTFNAQDGISLISTADSALEEVNTMLLRIKELSTQVSNGVCTDSDRDSSNKEYDSILSEIDRIAEATKFNNIALFKSGDVSESNYPFKEVTSRGTNLLPENFKIKDISDFITTQNGTNSLPTANPVLETQYPVGIDADAKAKYDILKNLVSTETAPHVVDQMLKQYTAFEYLRNSSISTGIKFVDENNSTLATMSTGSSQDVPTLFYQLKINVNGLDNWFEADGKTVKADKRRDLEATLSHEFMHAMMYESTTTGMAGNSADNYPSWFTEGMAQSASGALDNWVTGDIDAYLNSHKLNSTAPELEKNYASYGVGYLACMYLGHMAAGANTEVTASNLSEGMSIIMGDLIDGNSLDSIIKKYTAFESGADMASKFSDDADVNTFCKKLQTAAGAGRGGLISGDLTATDLVKDDDSLKNNALFKIDTNFVWVKNDYAGTGVNVWSGGGVSTAGVEPIVGYTPPKLGDPAKPDDPTKPGGLETTENFIKIHVDGSAININQYAVSSKQLGFSDLNLSTMEDANQVLLKVDGAIQSIVKIRSNLGATQNRLERSMEALQNMQENATASLSRITDTDMAKEMMRQTKYNIMQQVSQSMLIHIKTQPQQALQLLS